MKRRPLAAFCMAFIFIQVLFVITGVRKTTPVIAYKSNENLTAVGIVSSVETKEQYQLLVVTNVVTSKQSFSRRNGILVYDKEFLPLSLGNQIQFRGKVRLFDVPRNEGNFHQKQYYEKDGILFSVMANEIKLRNKSVWTVRNELSKLRGKWHQMLLQVLGEKDGGMLSAMILGEKGALDEEGKELYQRNGIGHILAISGLHLSFLGMAFYKGLQKCGLSYRSAGIVSVIFLFFYAIFTGFGVSTRRAFLMFSIMIGATLCGRVYDLATSFWTVACVLIFFRPLLFQDPAFLLSFGALGGIIYCYPIVQSFFGNRKKWLQGLVVSLAIQIFVFPITLYFFYEIPPYATALNLVVIPLMSIVLLLAFIGSLLYIFLPFVGEAVLTLVRFIFLFYDKLCEGALKLPFSRIVFGKPSIYNVLLCYVIFIFLWFYFQSKKKEKKKSVFLVCFLFFFLVSFPSPLWKRGDIRMTMVDVGQGDGIYVRGPSGCHYFIDGGSSDVKHVGKYRLESFLKSQGVGALDYVFISHGDGDHLNGIEELLKRQHVGVRINNLVLASKIFWDDRLIKLALLAKKEGTKVLIMKEGNKIKEELLEITCLMPSNDYVGEIGNASSMVLHLSFKQFDALFTGDVEKEGEEQLCKRGTLPKVEVLKVSHHGSKHSTSDTFLQLTKPQIGLISAGQNNSYHHPHDDTMKRLAKHKVKSYCTKECGAITLETNGENKIVLYSEIPHLLY